MANGYARYSGLGGGGGSGGGVTSLNGESGAVNIVAGTGISVTPSGQNITISNTEPGGSVTSVSVVSANGLAGTVATPTTTPAITLSTTITGILQGNGTAISAAATGNLTDAGTDGIVVTNGTGAVLGSGTSLAQNVADTTHNGYLASTDWNTFNSKQAAFSGLTTDGVIYATSATAVASTAAGTLGNPLVSDGGSGAPIFSATPTLAGIIDTTNVLNIKDSTDNTKIMALNVSGNTTGITTTLKPTSSTSQIINLPNVTATDTLASLGLAQTFANAQTFTTAPVFSSAAINQLLRTDASHNLTTINFSATVSANIVPLWDLNSNMTANALFGHATTIATAAGTTTLTIASPQYQYFTGSTTQTVKLPTSSVPLGASWQIYNLSTGVVTVEASGGATIQAMAPNTYLMAISNVATPTTVAGWYWQYTPVDSAAQIVPMGGTGLTSTTAYSLLAGGTTTTGNLQQVSGVGSSGQVLTSNGASALPTWQASSTSPTGSYAQGTMPTATSWSTTSASFTDPTNSGNNTLTVGPNSNITITAAASNLPGITFTPASSSAVYMIWAQIGIFESATNDGIGLSMTDGTTIISGQGGYSNASTGGSTNVTIGGIYVPGTGSAVTVKLQLLANGGTATIGNNGSQAAGTSSITWTVLRIF